MPGRPMAGITIRINRRLEMTAINTVADNQFPCVEMQPLSYLILGA